MSVTHSHACKLAVLCVLLFSILISSRQAISRSEPDSGINGVITQDNIVGDQIKISEMGGVTDIAMDAVSPAVAYNSQDQIFLMVWSGEDTINGKYEIWGQRIDAATGNQLGPDIQISGTGLANDADRDAERPDVAYNSSTNEFFVVWSADGITDNRFEIFGRYLNATTGALIGFQYRYSYMPPDGDINFDATNPAVAYNSTDNQFAIAWSADTNTAPLVDNENEIWVQRVFGGGGGIIGNNIQISSMADDGDHNYDAVEPDITYNATTNEYLVVWEGDINLPSFLDNDYEIFGQCLDASLMEVGLDDFLVSDMGYPTDHWADAQSPAVTYNATTNQYMVVWYGDDETDGDFEIFGQLINSSCYTISPNDFQISHLVRNSNSNYNTYFPDVTWNTLFNEYLVVWQDDKADVMEYEIWGQRVAPDGSLISYNRQISEMGPPGNTAYFGQTPAVAYSDRDNNLSLVTWAGEHDVDGKMEIYIRRFGGSYKVLLPAVMRNP